MKTCDEIGCPVVSPLQRVTPRGVRPAVFMCREHAGIDFGKPESQLEAMREPSNSQQNGEQS